ncbi:MAG: hypothetical protein ACRD5B_13705, partial [Nitrososphaeraceae archaeon]
SIMKCNNNEQSQSRRKSIMMILVVVTLLTLLVTMTATQAFAATNLNSSKSNIYRSSQNAQANEGGSVEQQSTNTCDCPSNGDQVASGDETKTITTEITQTINIECSGTDVTCNASQGRSRHDVSMNSIRNMK